MDKPQVMELFPTCIWSWRIQNSKLNDMLRTLVLSFQESSQFWQTSDDLHFRPEMSEFSEIARTAGTQVLEAMDYSCDGLEITSCWGNVSSSGGNHHGHVHPNSYLSGVYYVDAPQGAIVFRDPRPQNFVIMPTQRVINRFNSMTCEVEPKQGILMMFPSWLEHEVKENRTTDPRISIAFNLMVRGHVGQPRAQCKF